MSGVLDLREFVVGVWNYCTYDNTLMAKVPVSVTIFIRELKIVRSCLTRIKPRGLACVSMQEL